MKYHVDYHNRRTITWPPTLAKQVKEAASYLGVSGEEFIHDSIVNHLRMVYGAIALEGS